MICPSLNIHIHIFLNIRRLDAWGLSCLIWEIFNGQLNEQAQLKNTKRLPKKLIPLYSNLNKNVSQRCLIEDFLTKGQDKNGYFKNTFIDTMNFLEEIQVIRLLLLL